MRVTLSTLSLLIAAVLVAPHVIAEPKIGVSQKNLSKDHREAAELKEKIENESPLAEKSNEPIPQRLKELHEVTAKTEYEKEQAKVAELRLDAIRVSAFSWGAQEGMFWRYAIIKKHLDKSSLWLHSIADFNRFLVDGKMLMPVISKSERMFEQNSDSNVRTVSVSYTLEKPARLVSQPPTWRDYLIRSIDKPVKPHDALFPRSEVERVVWIDALNRGWKSGIEQANQIYDVDLRRMHADLDGMYRFRSLFVQNIVTLPSYKNSRYDVVKVEDGNSIHLNDVVYEITKQSEFSETTRWEPIFSAPEVN